MLPTNIIVVCFKADGYAKQASKVIQAVRPYVDQKSCMILSSSYAKCVNLSKQFRESFRVPHIELIPLFDFNMNSTIKESDFDSVISTKLYNSIIILTYSKKMQDIHKILCNKFYGQDHRTNKPHVNDIFIFNTIDHTIQSIIF